jgi:hypothetical protein
LTEATILQNLGSSGACFILSRCVRLGEKLELQIKMPFKKKSWMKYFAEVLRVEKKSADVAIAVTFSTARPVFIE